MHSSTRDRGASQKVFAFLLCSLDGYHEGPDGDLDWGLTDAEFHDWNLRQSDDIGALLLGRRTFEHFAEFWTSDLAAEQMPQIAAFMNAVPKTVVTRSGDVPPWAGTSVVDGSDLGADVRRLRAATTGDVGVFGSSGLAVSLVEQGLLDELRILVCPVLLGRGKSLFAGLSERTVLTAGPTTVFRSGNVMMRYTPTT